MNMNVDQAGKMTRADGLTKSARVKVLSAIGAMLGISFKIGELSFGAARSSGPGDSL